MTPTDLLMITNCPARYAVAIVAVEKFLKFLNKSRAQLDCFHSPPFLAAHVLYVFAFIVNVQPVRFLKVWTYTPSPCPPRGLMTSPAYIVIQLSEVGI